MWCWTFVGLMNALYMVTVASKVRARARARVRARARAKARARG